MATKAIIPATVDAAADNLETLYRLATQDEIFGGLAWYTIALGQADEIAQAYGIGILKVVGVIAAFSPQMPWSRNVLVARGAIAAWRNGLPVSGHTGAVLSKVRAILALPETATRKDIALIVWGAPQKSFKTVNFFYDILGAGAQEDGLHDLIGTATIDRWAAAGCVGSYISTLEMPELNAARYATCASAYRVMAERHHMETRQMQAILWVTIRRLNGVVD